MSRLFDRLRVCYRFLLLSRVTHCTRQPRAFPAGIKDDYGGPKGLPEPALSDAGPFGKAAEAGGCRFALRRQAERIESCESRLATAEKPAIPHGARHSGNLHSPSPRRLYLLSFKLLRNRVKRRKWETITNSKYQFSVYQIGPATAVFIFAAYMKSKVSRERTALFLQGGGISGAGGVKRNHRISA